MAEQLTPLIINLAPTGMIPQKKDTPHIPVSHQEIIETVANGLEHGVQMFHLHARDTDGQPVSDPEPYGRMVESIRKLPDGKEAIVCVTTSGRTNHEFAFRSRVLDLDGDMKPDMASLTLSSLNFAQSASINAPTTIRQLAAKMKEKGIKPEVEIFDIGMANFLQVLQKEQLIDTNPYVNVLLGNISSAQPRLPDVAALLSYLHGCTFSFAGLGRFQKTAIGLGILFAHGIRTGLEDNLWLENQRTTHATNELLIQQAITMASLHERPLMQRKATRALVLGTGS